MIRHGMRPAPLDSRDYSFHRTFPQFGALAPENLPLLDYSFDVGLTMPDQVADGLPFGCTGYTQADCKTDQERTMYLSSYTYFKTCFMEGHDTDRGCDIRTSAKSLRVYGALRERDIGDEGDGIPRSQQDLLAAQHRSGQSFSVDLVPGRDWFDSMRIALRSQMNSLVKNSISAGTPWFPEWSAGAIPANGLLTSLFVYNGEAFSYSWHNYKICGEKTIDGQPTLQVKAWQGRNFGASGWVYMDRATFNRAFNIYGTIALITAQAAPGDIQTVQLDILQTVLLYLNRILGLISTRIQLAAHA